MADFRTQRKRPLPDPRTRGMDLPATGLTAPVSTPEKGWNHALLMTPVRSCLPRHPRSREFGMEPGLTPQHRPQGVLNAGIRLLGTFKYPF